MADLFPLKIVNNQNANLAYYNTDIINNTIEHKYHCEIMEIKGYIYGLLLMTSSHDQAIPVTDLVHDRFSVFG